MINVAHRGASAYAPENTLPAVDLAVAQRADLVEIDVRQTSDGVLVAMHDATLTRTTDAAVRFPGREPWRVADFSYSEIQRLDAGGWFGREFTGVPVPTLREVLDVLEDTDLGLLLEVKSPGAYPGIGDRTAAELDARTPWLDAGRQLIVESFDWDFIRQFSRRTPKLDLGLLGRPGPDDLADAARYADLVNPQYGCFGQEYLRQIQLAGMRALVWTVDDPAQIRATVAMGADGVITNRPDVLRALLRSPAG